MTKMLGSASVGKGFNLQISSEIEALAIRNIIRTPLEKGKDELHLKFSSKNQKNPNTEIFVFRHPC